MAVSETQFVARQSVCPTRTRFVGSLLMKSTPKAVKGTAVMYGKFEGSAPDSEGLSKLYASEMLPTESTTVTASKCVPPTPLRPPALP
eukprot:2057419-Rhodomonas_salina.1